jgi:hypothetical protein
MTKNIKKKLTTLQRKALISIANPMRGTPTAGMEVALRIPPLQLWLEDRGEMAMIGVKAALNIPNGGEQTVDLCKGICQGTRGNSGGKGKSARKYTVYTNGSKMDGRGGYR